MAQTRSAAAGIAAIADRRAVLRRIGETGGPAPFTAMSMPVSTVIPGREGQLFCTITLFDSQAAARADWLALQTVAMVHPFQDWHWHDSWDKARVSAAGEASMIALVRDVSGTPKALYSLHVLPSRWGQTWVQPTAHDISDYVSPLISPDFAGSAGPDGLGELFSRVLSLRGTRGAWQALRQPGPMAGYHTGRLRPSPLNGHEAVLQPDWMSWYELRRSHNKRKNDRYRERRLSKEGDVSFIEASTAAQAIDITRFAIDVKQRQLAGRGISSAFDDPAVRQMFVNLAARPDGPLRAFMLDIDGEPVSAVICLVGGGRCCYVISSYKPGRYDAYSPGAVLLRRVLEWACDQSLEVFDFTIGDEAYKFDWAERKLPLYYAAGGDTVTGMIRAGGVHLRQVAERVLRSNDRLLLMSQRIKHKLAR